MSKRTAKQIIDAFTKANTEKAKWDRLYEDVFRYGMPGRFNDTRDLEARKETSGQPEHKELYSSVMEQSCDRLVGKLQTMLTPAGVDWIDFEAGYLYEADEGKKAEADSVNKELGKVAKMLNVFKDTSNFDLAVNECYYDLIAGSMCLACLEGTVENPFRFVAVPIKDVVVEEGIFGEPSNVYRKLKIKQSLVRHQWPDAQFEVSKEKENDDVQLLECTYKDYDTDTFRYVVLKEDEQKILLDREYKTNPFIVTRWSKCAGETYGRGLGLKCLADVKTLNKIMEYALRAFAFTVPVFLAQSSDSYDPSNFLLYPGAINPVPSTATNNPTITQLGVNQTTDLTAFHTEQLEMNIKRSMMDSTIPNDPSRDLTATEIAQRSQELKSEFNNIGRLQTEFMYPLIRRMIEVAQSFGLIPPDLDPRNFNGYGFKIRINTVLASQQRATEVQNTLMALQSFVALDPNMQLLPKVVKLEALMPDLMRKMGLGEEFVAGTEEIVQAEVQEAQQTQAMADADAARQMEIDANKEAAKRE